jgi:diadenosine tetraphosphate (Ap4A) HIT family hydrolase
VAHSFNAALAGWLVVLPRRHVTAVDELEEAETVELGPLLRALTAGLRATVGCQKTYVMLFAEQEGFGHVHLHVVPRMADLPADHQGPGVFHYLRQPEGEWVSQAAMDDLARKLRQVIDGSAAVPGA